MATTTKCGGIKVIGPIIRQQNAVESSLLDPLLQRQQNAVESSLLDPLWQQQNEVESSALGPLC